MDLADQRHPAHVLQLPLELLVQVGAPAVEVRGRVSREPVVFARDEQRHAPLDVGRAVVEGEAQAADVRVLRREEPLARVGQLGVGAHEVEGVVREVVVHCFLTQLFANQEDLGLRACWGARGLVREVFVWDRCTLDIVHVPLLEDVGEANVVVRRSSAPVDVHVAGPYEAVEDLELELCG